MVKLVKTAKKQKNSEQQTVTAIVEIKIQSDLECKKNINIWHSP